MLKLILIISVVAYIIVGFLTYTEYKKKFNSEEKISTKKVIYIVIHGFLYALIGLLIAVLGYLILTM